MARLDYSAPGVYVEEVDRGSRPISGVPMNVAGFVGFTEDIRGDARRFEPQLITDWTQYLECFSKVGSDGFTDFDAYLPFAVKGWFDNGGGRCWVVSLGTQQPIPNDGDSSSQELPSATLKTSLQKESLKLVFDEAKLTRYSEEGRCNIVISSSQPREIDLPEDLDEDEAEARRFDTGEFFTLTIRQGDREVEKYPHLTLDPQVEREDSDRYHLGYYARTALKDITKSEIEIQESLIQEVIAQENGNALFMRPANGTYEVVVPLKPYKQKFLTNKMKGQPKEGKGIQGLFDIDEVSMIACPDLMLAYREGWLELEQVNSIMRTMVDRCENSAPNPPYQMVVLDPPPVKLKNSPAAVPPSQQKPQDVEKWLQEFNHRSQFAALYYPWINVPNPRDNGKPIAIPPCGHMMGIWCQTDESRGIHKAPANVRPRGVDSLVYSVNFREQEFLNPKGINCIRTMQNLGGIRVWGARTLASENEIQWRYINVRRLMSYIERSIQTQTQWAVFEPNDEDLWARVRRTVNNFLERLWREGALYGKTPQEAFFVKCDAELNKPDTMMLGRLYVDVGVAPVRPAEFIVFRIGQIDPTESGT